MCPRGTGSFPAYSDDSPLCVVDLFWRFERLAFFLLCCLFHFSERHHQDRIYPLSIPLSRLEAWTAVQPDGAAVLLPAPDVCVLHLGHLILALFSLQSNGAFNTSCSLCTSACTPHPRFSAVRGSVIIGSSGSVGVFSLQSFLVGNTFGLLQRALQVLQHVVFRFTACLYIDSLAHLASIWIGLVILLATASFPSHLIVLACNCLALNERRLSISNKSHVVTLLLRND